MLDTLLISVSFLSGELDGIVLIPPSVPISRVLLVERLPRYGVSYGLPGREQMTGLIAHKPRRFLRLVIIHMHSMVTQEKARFVIRVDTVFVCAGTERV